ncbi:Bifunctional hemolysin/adenylate cyclase precursor [Stieleria maiorica]|uniref:Bifunctional hemolysin/adenylate cyclase n=1 Tax=Stieleria maiorica TaxID=2795974 RepID=A0A5B9MIS0_9BACT|nr:PKD domain-containing protein [Stieleria maiorica]QEG01099.1 Bifunctional hemolysin/adenylate cyclase precursor [Stieleria maiorica]
MSTLPSTAHRRRRKLTRHRRSRAEQLERRDLLAASLSIGDATVEEGNPGGAPAELKFPITRAGDTSEELTVTFEVFAAGDDLPTDDERGAAQRGLAAAGGKDADFVVPAFQTVTIPAGSVNETLTITVNPDVVPEGDERLEVRFKSVVGEVTFASEEDTRATGTIVNDDRPNELLELLTSLDTEERDRLIGQVKDGFDDTFAEIVAGIETAVDEISGVPIVGGQLADAVEPVLTEIEAIQTDLTELVETVFTSTSENLIADFQNAMFEILEPILMDSPDAGTDISASDILLSYGADDLDGPNDEGDGNPDPGTSWVQFDFHLGQRTIQDLPFEFNLGAATALPGLEALGLSVDASDGLRFDLRWDLRYGFGLSQRYGIDPNFDLDYFYVNSGAVDVTGTPVEEFRASIDIKSAPAKDDDGFDVLSTDAGLQAEATIGLLAAKVEDGIPFAVDITAERGFDFGGSETEADFTLVIDSGGDEPVQVDISGLALPTGADDDLAGAIENLGTFLIDLQAELIAKLEGKFNDVETTQGEGQTAFVPVTVSLDFGSINGFANPDLPTTPSIVLSAEIPQISSMTIIGGGELGFAESNLGSLLDPGPFGQFDDGRSAALGFDASPFDESDFTTASSEVVPGRFRLRAGAAAPASGLLRQDTEFTLVLNNGQGAESEERILISISEEQNRDIKSLRDQLNTKSLESVFRDTINQAISQQQKNNAYETIDVQIDDEGFFVLTSRGDAANPGPTMDIDYPSTDQSKISVVFTVDIDDPNWTLFNQRQNPNDQAFLDRVTRGDIQDATKITDRFQPEAEASLALKLHTTADLNALIEEAGDSIPTVPLIDQGLLFPQIEFDFVLDATASAKFKNPKTPDPDNDEAGEKRYTNELETLSFENVSIDIGTLLETFVQPIANFVGTALGPASVIVGGLAGDNFLDLKLPVLDELHDKWNSIPEKLLDLAGDNKDHIYRFREALGTVLGIAESVEVLLRDYEGEAIALGCFEYFKPENADSRVLAPCAAASAIDSATSTEASQFINAYNQATSTVGGLRFDFLQPTNFVSLLSGEDADLVSLNIPALNVTLGKSINIDFGPATLNGDVEAEINTELGLVYDTIGLGKIVGAFRRGDDPNWDDLLDGIYIRNSDGKEVDVQIEAGANAKVDVEIASGSVRAELSGSVGLDVLDPNEDGALRLDEIQSVTGGDPDKVFCLVDASANLSGELDLEVEFFGIGGSLSDIGLEGLTEIDVNLSFQRGELKDLLEDLGFDLDCLDEPNPILASPRIENGEEVIRIHTGPYARDRVEGDVSDEDGPAVISVEQNGNEITVIGFGGETTVPYKPDQPPLIVITGGPHGDVFDLSDVSSLSIRMEGAGGGDTLIGGDQQDGFFDEIYGGNGSDFIDPGRGDDVVVTGAGSNVVLSSPGADTIDASANTASGGFVYGYKLDALGRLERDGQGDPIPLPDRNVGDTVIGSDMDDFLVGTSVAGGKGEDTIRGTGTGGTLDGGAENDVIVGSDGDETLFGGPGEDTLNGGGGADSILGGDDNDELISGYGDILVSGGGGEDELTVDLGTEISGLGIVGIKTSLGDGNYTAQSINDSTITDDPFPSESTSYAGIETIAGYRLGNGQDTVEINGVAVEVEVLTLAGEDTIRWINNSAEVELDAGEDRDELVIDRSGQSDPIDATLQSRTIRGFANERLVFSGLEQITVTTGSGSDRVRIDAPAADSTIRGGSGDHVFVERLTNVATITAEQVILELDSDASGLRNEFGDGDRLRATVDKLIVDNRENIHALEFSVKDREVLVAGLTGPLIENTSGIDLIEFRGTTAATTQDTLQVVDAAESSKTFRIEDRLVEVIQGGDVLKPAARSSEVVVEYPEMPVLDGPLQLIFAPSTGAPGRSLYAAGDHGISIFQESLDTRYEFFPVGKIDSPFGSLSSRTQLRFDPFGTFLYVSKHLPSERTSKIAVYQRDTASGALSLVEVIDEFPEATLRLKGYPAIVDMQVIEERVFLTVEDTGAPDPETHVLRFERERLSVVGHTGKLIEGKFEGGPATGVPIDSVWDPSGENLFVLTDHRSRLQVHRYSADPNNETRLRGPFLDYETGRGPGQGEKLEVQPVRHSSPRKVYLVQRDRITVFTKNGATDQLEKIQDVAFLPRENAPSSDSENDLEFNGNGTVVYINNGAELQAYHLGFDGLFLDERSNSRPALTAMPFATSGALSVTNDLNSDSLARDPRSGRLIATTGEKQFTTFTEPTSGDSIEAIQQVADGVRQTFDTSSLLKLVYSTDRPRNAYGLSDNGFLIEFDRSVDGDPQMNPESILTPDDWEFDRLRDKGLAFATDLLLADDIGDDEHLYVATSDRTGGGGITLYRRDGASGDLTFDPTIDGFVRFNGVRTLQLSPDGDTLWAASLGSVTPFTRDKTTGYLTQGTGTGTLDFTSEFAIDPESDFIFLALGGSDGGIATRLQSDVANEPGARFEPLPNATSVKLIGDQIYAGTSDGLLKVYNVNHKGELTLLQTVSGGSGGAGSLSDVVDIVSSRDDRYVFAGSAEGVIISYRRDHSTGRLSFSQRTAEGILGIEGIVEMTSLTFAASENEYLPDLLYVTSPNGWTAIEITPSNFVRTSSYRVGFDDHFASLTVASADAEGGGDFSDSVSSTGVSVVPLTIETFGGADDVSIASQPGRLTVDTGPGSDFVSLRSVVGEKTTIELGSGDDTIDVNLPGLDISGDDAIVSINGDSPLFDNNPPLGDTLTYIVGGLTFDADPETALETPEGQISVGGQVIVKWEEIENLGALAALSASITVTPGSVAEGNSVDLTATASAEGVIVAESDYQWDLNGDGVFGDRTGSTLSLDWSALQALGIDDDGNYPIAVEVATSGLRTIASASIVITNADPVLSATVSPGTIHQFESVSLTLGSTDPGDDTIERWEIDWDSDGSVDDIYFIAAGVVPHVYNGSGTQTITATAFDEDGGPYAAVTETVVVNEIPPRVRAFEGTTVLNEGGTGNYTLVATGGTTTPLSWMVDFGDGTIEQITSTEFTHTYADDGIYTINAIVLENDGSSQSATATLTVEVNPVDPTIITEPGASPIDEGQVYTLGVAAIDDPGDDTITHWTIDWGDGTVEAIVGDIRSAAHPYLDDSAAEPGGEYQITVWATDEDGTYQATAAVPVAVTNVAEPMISVPDRFSSISNIDFTVAEGQPLELILSNDDPGNDTTTEWIIDWDGDGPLTPVSYPSDPTAPLRHVSFVYTAEIAPLQITALMIDEDGEHPANSLTGEVTNTPPTPRIRGGSTTAVEGSPFFVTLDPGTEGTNTNIVRWRIEWNDGTGAETIPLEEPSTNVTLSHVFPDGDGSGINVNAFAIDEVGQQYPAALTVPVLNQPPTISLSGPASIEENTEYQLTLGPVIDPAIIDTVSRYVIHWGDGSSTQLTSQEVSDLGGVVPHVYLDDPPFPGNVDTIINVDLVDEDGRAPNAGSTRVQIVNVAPVADAGGPYQILLPATQVTLSALAIDQSPLDTFTFEWDFDDDGVFGDATGPNPIFDATGAFPGQVFNIGLRVTDDDGDVSEIVTTTVQYLSIPEIDSITLAQASINENDVAVLTVDFSDTDPNQTHTITVDWGDGVEPTVQTLPVGERSITLTHPYLDDDPTDTPADSNTIDVTVANTAADDTGSTGITVANVDPDVLEFVSDAAMLEAKSNDLAVTISGCVGDIGSLDTHVAVIDWGDGSDPDTIDVDQLTRGFAAQHDYPGPGIYEITAKVIDDDGGVSEIATTAAVIQGVGLVDGTLFIIGTGGRDHVKLDYKEKKDELDLNVKFNQGAGQDHVKATFQASSIQRIVAFLCGGDDHYHGKIDGKKGSSISIRQIVFGGVGLDHLQGGDTEDALLGGAGKDDIRGHGGNDLLIGGHGEDKIHGDHGDDLLIGDAIGADESAVTTVGHLDAALQSWAAAADPGGAVSALSGIIDDGDDDRLHDRKGANEFIEGASDQPWIWWVDVDGNGESTALDALLIINRLSMTHRAKGEADGAASETGIYDVNLDGRVTLLDALQVINALARSTGPSAGSAPRYTPPVAAWHDAVDTLMKDRDPLEHLDPSLEQPMLDSGLYRPRGRSL